MSIVQTSRDTDLIQTLTLRVHLLTLEQVAFGWWGNSLRAPKTARERLGKLQDAGFVQRHQVNIHPLLPLNESEIDWSPGKPTPRFGQVAYRLRSRWTEPLQMTTVYVATRKAANQFGGFGGKFKHRTQLTHDTHLAEIYVRLLQSDPTIRYRWVGEELLQDENPSSKVPDAVIKDADGFPNLIVEFGGQYDARRLQRFHDYCLNLSVRYQLW